ncbi:MAG: 2,6-beta-D-fructofuranosidase, partial [Armatimonadetes bacterium]|nr:2,6-beta-D-fructofuranosidase [Armatimonadota bacterium]
MWAVALALAGDMLVADFEGSTYGAWKTTGTAFGQGPAEGTLPNQMAVSGYKGKRLVNSFFGGDAATGTLTSPKFKVQRRYITFLIGGGKDLEKTCVLLKVDGKVVRTASGPNDKPGGSEALRPAFWDVSEFLTKSAVIEVIDKATGGWGHVNLDHIVQTDTKPPVAVPLVKRTFTGSGRYLNLPIKDGAPLKRVKLLMDGKLVVANNIGL